MRIVQGLLVAAVDQHGIWQFSFHARLPHLCDDALDAIASNMATTTENETLLITHVSLG